MALFHWPITLWFQSWVLGFYTEHDRTDRALALAADTKVGILMDITGPIASFIPPLQNAANLAVKLP